MFAGIIAGLGTGALWGLIFIAPLAVAPYSGVDLAIMRYLFFAAASLAVFALIPATRARGLAPRVIAEGIALGVLGYGVFYGFLVIAVSYAGPQIAALVVGILPVLLAIAGNLGGGGIKWRALAPPLVLIALGLAVVNGMELAKAPTPEARSDVVFGILAALGSVAAWTGYGILNARALTRRPGLNSMTWTGLQGVGAGFGIVLFGILAAPFGFVSLHELGLSWPEARGLLVWAVITGVFGGWGAAYLWTIASKRLPLVLSGQIYVSEPAFGVIYGFLWQGRWPTWPEAVGISCVFGGVLLGISVFGRSRRTIEEIEAAGQP